MDELLENCLYDILDDGITDKDEILFRLCGVVAGFDEAKVLDLANAYLEHYGLRVS